MTALTLDTIGLCGFDYRFNSFYRRDYHPFVESLVRSLETIMMTRGLPLEGLWMQKRRKTLAEDIAFLNEMVDEIIAERRRSQADGSEGKKDMLGGHADRRRPRHRRAARRRQHPLSDQHVSDRGPRDHQRPAVLHDLRSAEASRGPGEGLRGSRSCARARHFHASRPTSRSTQLTYVTQILKEALRLWPPAPTYRLAPLKDETIGGKYKLKKNTFVTVLVMALHRDPSVWGPNPDVFDPENFSREAEAKRPINAWKPFGNGQRACIGRGFAMHEAALAIGDDPAALQTDRRASLPDASEGNADDQAGWFQDQGATAQRPGARRVRRWRRRGDADRRMPQPPRARTRPGHNTPLLVLYGSNLGSAEELGHPRRRSRRGQRFCDKARAARRLRRKTAGAGRRADLLRLLQRCAARQRRASSSNGSAAICRRMPLQNCATPCSAAATATGLRPTSRCRG